MCPDPQACGSGLMQGYQSKMSKMSVISSNALLEGIDFQHSLQSLSVFTDLGQTPKQPTLRKAFVHYLYKNQYMSVWPEPPIGSSADKGICGKPPNLMDSSHP